VKAFSRLILRFSGIIVLIGTALAVLGAYYSFHLYQNLRPDLEELLPSTARSVMDLDEVTTRLEAIDNLAILIFSKHPDATRRFVDHLSAKLSKAPKDTIASVEYRIDREIKFFKARRALYLDLKDLLKVLDYIHGRVE
jgi:uncharacterized protein